MDLYSMKLSSNCPSNLLLGKVVQFTVKLCRQMWWINRNGRDDCITAATLHYSCYIALQLQHYITAAILHYSCYIALQLLYCITAATLHYSCCIALQLHHCYSTPELPGSHVINSCNHAGVSSHVFRCTAAQVQRDCPVTQVLQLKPGGQDTQLYVW